jgi:hypothetical protein
MPQLDDNSLYRDRTRQAHEEIQRYLRTQKVVDLRAISALRGPDFTFQVDLEGDRHFSEINLKVMTTGRIRAIICPSYRGIVTHTPLDKQLIKNRDDLLHHLSTLPSYYNKVDKYGFQHFMCHYLGAIEDIKANEGWDLTSETRLWHKPESNLSISSAWYE